MSPLIPLATNGGVCRLFMDEVGHADLKASTDLNQRYLSITGVIVRMDYYHSTIIPSFSALKKGTFGTDSVVLHRTELVRMEHPFTCLRESAKRANFDSGILEVLDRAEYTVLTTTIDKLEHLEKYSVWHANPYHYCLECILERYVMWLERRRMRGDIMAEARGKHEDKMLKKAFSYFYSKGTRYISAKRISASLTTGELKFKRKIDNICGLQMADLIAHPSFRFCWAKRTGEEMTADFGRKVAEILEGKKYDRNSAGKTDSFGRKWLP